MLPILLTAFIQQADCKGPNPSPLVQAQANGEITKKHEVGRAEAGRTGPRGNDKREMRGLDLKILKSFSESRQVPNPRNVLATIVSLDKLVNALKTPPSEDEETIKAYEAELAEWKKLKDK